jgi:hypothetical protein
MNADCTYTGVIVAAALIARVGLDIIWLSKYERNLSIAYASVFLLAAIAILSCSVTDVFGYLSLAVGCWYVGVIFYKRRLNNRGQSSNST